MRCELRRVRFIDVRISVHNETYIERGNGLIVSGDLSYLADLNSLREVPATERERDRKDAEDCDKKDSQKNTRDNNIKIGIYRIWVVNYTL